MDERWIKTLLILFVFGLLSFVVTTLLVMFIDPSLSQDSRAAIVGSWTTVYGIVSLMTIIGRHT